MEHQLERSNVYEGYLDRLIDETDDTVGIPERDGSGSDVHRGVDEKLIELQDELFELSHTIHSNPELAFEERHAAGAVATLLERLGFDVEVGVHGLETAFEASVGQGGPTVAIIAEYDALPEIGHGCGHNVICASGVGGFLAAAPFVDQFGGTLKLMGTPAEEGGSGKELIARAGGFNDVDCAMMVHPAGSPSAAITNTGMRQVEVVYHGIEAHAAAVPFMGRNALDACVTAYSMIAQLRQHMLPDDRIHGVITDGGSRPNIIPDRASALYYLRSRDVDTLIELSERMDAIFRAAAQGTGTAVEVRWDVNPLVVPLRNNMALANRFAKSHDERGKSMPLRSPVPSGSTDMANVSVRVPSIHPKVAVAPADVPIHTAEFARYAGSPSGDEAILDGAYGLAVTALDYLADEELRNDVATEFEATGGVVDVEALGR